MTPTVTALAGPCQVCFCSGSADAFALAMFTCRTFAGNWALNGPLARATSLMVVGGVARETSLLTLPELNTI